MNYIARAVKFISLKKLCPDGAIFMQVLSIILCFICLMIFGSRTIYTFGTVKVLLIYLDETVRLSFWN